MRTYRAVEKLSALAGPLHLAVGVFDGLHLGHQALIRQAREDAEQSGGSAAVVSFAPHPQRVLHPDRTLRILTSTKHKLRLLSRMDVHDLVLVEFTRQFARTPPERFIERLSSACNPLGSICVGHSWSWGKDRRGNLELLRELGRRYEFHVHGIPPVEIEGEPVSSTRIRRLVEQGNLDQASRLLGRRFSILGTVEQGDQLGRNIGFPTANLGAHSEQFPPDGVYFVQAEFDERRLPGLVNIGCRPTLEQPEAQRRLELHLLDFSGDLYGKEIEVFFHERLRPEQKFSSVDELRRQIARDMETAKKRAAATS